MFDSIGSLIGRLPRHSRISGAVLALSVRMAFEEVLFKVCADLPADRLKLVKATTFKDGVLTVECSGLLKSELSMRSREILNGMNKIIGKRVVLKLRFVGG